MILVLSLIMNGMNAQVESQGKTSEYVQKMFAEVFTFESDQPGKGRVDIYIQVPYPEINFIKDADHYIGRLDISVSAFTPDNEQVWQKNQMVELQVKEFSQTISDKLSSIKQFSTDLTPGKYDFVFQVTDQESKKVASFRKSLEVRDIGKDSLAMSDVMLVHRVNNDGVRKNIVPNLSGIISRESMSFFLFFEIYRKIPIDSVKMICQFINSKRDVIGQYVQIEYLTENRTQVIWKIDTPALASDHYTLLIEMEGMSLGQSYRSSTSRSCQIKLKSLPSTIVDIDKATDQLIYIAKGGELDYIREAVTPEEKLIRFLDFWFKHDPDPKTSRNQLMEEYYARVAYADRNFGNYMEGWKSDRGMVLIKYGPPQNVERHPFDSDSKPYEVWYYYEQNREFIFVDESGFGDYRLRYPTTDLWGRVR
jgi:GWxTD domain-containing protein